MLIATLFATFVSGFAAAQVMSLPTPPPSVAADSADWYRAGEPIPYGDSLYYPAGAIRHFDANRLVRSGAHRGVPLYTDKFLEPYGRIFVPLSGGLVQPYERRREGNLSGTTGNQAPSFPVAISAEAARTAASGAGATPAEPARTVEPARADDGAVSENRPSDRSGAIGTTGVTRPAPGLTSLVKPTGLNAVFVTYQGSRWRPAGPAVEFSEARFRAVEDYQGFPVFVARDGDARMIYLPSRAGMLTPYEPIAASSTRPSPDRRQPRQK
ncbi:MAG: hypothetical protein ACRD1S_15555 [Vicinamibacterales bacterium]